jgi:hypothetical protein
MLARLGLAVPVVFGMKSVTQEQYEESARELAKRERLEPPEDWPVP